MWVKGTPNKANVCSDPTDPEFDYRVIDDDGIEWKPVPTDIPSGFCDWAKWVEPPEFRAPFVIGQNGKTDAGTQS